MQKALDFTARGKSSPGFCLIRRRRSRRAAPRKSTDLQPSSPANLNSCGILSDLTFSRLHLLLQERQELNSLVCIELQEQVKKPLYRTYVCPVCLAGRLTLAAPARSPSPPETRTQFVGLHRAAGIVRRRAQPDPIGSGLSDCGGRLLACPTAPFPQPLRGRRRHAQDAL
jgi:hypothetical protein